MKYLRVKNWEKHQNYSDRRPPWIRLYTALIDGDDVAYNNLADAHKAMLIHVWLLASRHENKIPEELVTARRLNLKSRPDVSPLLQSGFVEWYQDASIQQASGLHLDNSRASVSVSDSISVSDLNVDAEFDRLWKAYPRPIGRKEARKHFAASVRTADDLAAIETGLAHYRAATAGTEEKFIQHGKTWFNNWRDWVSVIPSAKIGPDGLSLAQTDEDRQFERQRAILEIVHQAESMIAVGGNPEADDAARERFNAWDWPIVDAELAAFIGKDRWAKWLSWCEAKGISMTRKTA